MYLLTDPYSLHTPQLNKELKQSYLASDDKISTSKVVHAYFLPLKSTAFPNIFSK